jgi:hypothetical protein
LCFRSVTLRTLADLQVCGFVRFTGTWPLDKKELKTIELDSNGIFSSFMRECYFSLT